MTRRETYKDNRPQPDGHWAKINGKKFMTVTVGGVQRFQENRIVRAFLTAASEGKRLTLNDILVGLDQGAYCREEAHEFYRLIGYSVSGFEEVFEDDLIDSDWWRKAPRGICR